MSVTGEVVVGGLRMLEGPVWCPADDQVPVATLACTSVTDGALYRVWLEEGRIETIALVGGGANAAQRASDGGFVIAQNGGIDYARTDLYDKPPPYRPVAPGIQHVAPSGAVRYVSRAGYLAPNDLIVTTEGTLLFTDPPSWPPPEGSTSGRVHALTLDGAVSVVTSGLAYPNGIALEPDGTMLVVEGDGLLRFRPEAATEWVVRAGTTEGDGLAVDAEGRIYLCAYHEAAVRVFEPGGRELDRLLVPDGGQITNCCFGGEDGRTLFATCGIPGAVVAWEGLPTPGLPLHRWPVH
jgi:gluconolactonase